MFVPVKWMKEYVNLENISTRELADKLNSSGSHVESIENVDKGVEKVVVGKILEIEKHPDADKLVITKIDIGEEEKIQIVTGANNIKIGDVVPVALVGAKLPGGMKIKKGKLRGIESFGMLCSADELGIADNVVPKNQKDGIFILNSDLKLGQDIKEVMGLSEEVIEFEITPNRPDCLSIVGMARESAASTMRKIKMPEISVKNEEENIGEYFNSVEVEDLELCNRYYCKVVKNIKVGESPIWIQTRLMEAGVRPINNIVDITNYVMIELGQPIHAFDLDKLSDKKIIVKKAIKGSKFKTLDGVERNLDEEMLLINDGKEPVAIAGVMGGIDSEVTENTSTILVESANFNEKSIRKTSKKLGLRTEASTKFEKGLDPNLSEMACKRVCYLIEEIGAGIVISGEYDIKGKLREENTIEVSIERINKLIGKSIPVENTINILDCLEIKTEIIGDIIKCEIPTFRGDLKIEEDIIEEIARVYGIDNIEELPLEGVLSRGRKTCKRTMEDNSKTMLIGMGLNEIMTYSFISPKSFDKLRVSKDSILRNCVTIRNPLGEDFSIMRTTLMSNTMDVLSRNYKRGIESMFTFEIGNIFIPKELPVKNLPKEKKLLSIGLYGEGDYFTIKGVVDEFLNRIGIYNMEYLREENNPSYHPGRTATIVCEDYLLGTIGEVHPEVLEEYGIKEKVYYTELDFDIIFYLSSDKSKKYRALPKYPSINRDIALVVPEEVMVKELEKIILESGGKLVEKVELFDVYQGEQVEKGKKSIAYSIVYRSLEKTLTEEDIVPTHEKILSKLEEKLNISLRK